MGDILRQFKDERTQLGPQDGKWFDFAERGLELKIKPMTPDEFNRVGQRAKKTTFKRHQRSEEVDSKKLNDLMMREIVVDWRGMTAGLYCLYTGIPVDRIARIYGIPQEDATKAAVPFGPDASQFLGEQCTGVWTFVYESATELAAEHEGETKN